jgi:hypothetical protein
MGLYRGEWRSKGENAQLKENGAKIKIVISMETWRRYILAYTKHKLDSSTPSTCYLLVKF